MSKDLTIMETALGTVRDSSVLAAADLAALDGMSDELRHVWATAQIFRTRTEMEYSVLDDIHHPTDDAKYWQCVREQDVMLNELVGLSFEFRKNRIEQLKVQRALDKEADALEQATLQIDLDRLCYGAAHMERVAADRMRELRNWSEIKTALIARMKHGVLDVNAHQRESLPLRFEMQAAMVTPSAPPADRINLLGLHQTAQNRAVQPLTAALGIA